MSDAPVRPPEPRDFIREIVAADLQAGRTGGRVATRFPPEPNGYLHIGHASAICLSFGIAEETGGTCNLRFDDTNPETEEARFVDAIKRDIRWLGFEWDDERYASDYFETLYEFAERLIEKGKAYVDSSSEEEIRAGRGTVTTPGTPGPYRDRSVEENRDLFRRMRACEFPDGSHVLRARIDLAHPNMVMRDPVLWRIRHAHHYRRGDAWCIYPLYDFTHGLSDAIEDITHSFCTMEFENNREIYDWLLDEVGFEEPRPHQYEFARRNLDYTVMSKRKLLRLVEEGHVAGWDDPRMPTIAALRRRGVTPEAIRAFADMIGVTRADNRAEIAQLEYAIRDDLNRRVPRVMCVVDPLEVEIVGHPGDTEWLDAPLYPRDVPLEGSRPVPFGPRILIERDDFMEEPVDGFTRLAPGREVRLRYGYFITCTDVVKDAEGRVIGLRCTYDPATRGGDAPDGRRPSGTIHWVSAEESLPCEVRLYDRLFSVPDPDDVPEGQDFTVHLNPDSLVVRTDARIEPFVGDHPPGTRYQFERVGYFVSDAEDSRPGHLVYNRTVPLRDTWSRASRTEEPTAPSASQETAGPAHDPEAAALARERAGEEAVRFERFHGLGVGAQDADLLARSPALARLFDDGLASGAPPARLAAWTVNEVRRAMDGAGDDPGHLDGSALGRLVVLVERGALSAHDARTVLATLVREGGDPAELAARVGQSTLSDDAALAPLVAEILEEFPDRVEAYRGGRSGLLQFFVGQGMRKTGGNADPARLSELFRERLRG